MRALAGLLRALVVDPRSQRALDETLLDAAEEIARSRGVLAGGWAIAQASLALIRVALGSLGRELGHLRAGRVALALLATFSLPLAVSALTGIPLAASTRERVILFALISTGSIALFFPISAFVIGIASARSRGSLLGLCVMLVAAELALLGWGMPEAYQQFRQRVYVVDRPSTMPAEIERGVNELLLPQLIDAARTGGRARKVLYVRSTLCAATMWFGCLGYASIRLSWRARTLWVVVAVLTICSLPFLRSDGFAPLIAFGLALTVAVIRAHRDPISA